VTHHPGDHGHKPERCGELSEPKEQRRVVKPSAPAQPNAQQHKSQHQDGASDHDPEGEERNCDRRTLVSREILQALHLAVEAGSAEPKRRRAQRHAKSAVRGFWSEMQRVYEQGCSTL